MQLPNTLEELQSEHSRLLEQEDKLSSDLREQIAESHYTRLLIRNRIHEIQNNIFDNQ